ncbi:MAG: undecaprenyldiphospho-muramoylpentapeptide beta-N-acetylglucosaminyltransferase [Cyclobacteriaceae bacterium]
MISGGGTGGHIYPAIAIGQELKAALDNVELLFVGAKGKMEMQKVPEAGFEIVGLWISGLQRKLTIQNLLFPFKLISSIWKSFRLLRSFKPHVVVGVGGYASGPLLFAASVKKIPTLIQEQNSYAGLTNKLLSKRVNVVCVAHEGLETYFPNAKVIVTGNPVRKTITSSNDQKMMALDHFGLQAGKKTILIIGGSLGARTINEAILANLDELLAADLQLIWQTGGFYYDEMIRRTEDKQQVGVSIQAFIANMKYAYQAADIVVSRSGALSLAELMLTAKPCILIPSPNVAEDHQNKNAKALEERNAAIVIDDNRAIEDLKEVVVKTLNSPDKLKSLQTNISKMSRPNAAMDIANEIIRLVA